MEVYAKIDADTFKELVAGRKVELSAVAPSGQSATVKLILADIGWGKMIQLIRDAMEEHAEPAEPCIIPPGEPLRV